ncbi:sulfotransferase family 2 domain-containing protein [Falsiroseomonas sp. CW058]|uniref:sulfotransferase family 2 domain-containing protein n=1 Tax=Falsiroseomonas sp. CW058 TaxID=3388664 RepID=UPI003D31583B
MTAGLLLSGDIAAWLAPAPPPPLWLFVHVPKTAGSSLTADIATMLQPYCSIHIDHADRRTHALVRFDAATEAFLAARRSGPPARFASGHVAWRHVEAVLAEEPATRLFTVLREPAARLVSDYLYQRSAMHPLAAEVKARIPDFDAFLELPGQRNRAARHLAPAPMVAAGDAAAVLRHLRTRYAFVGLQERHELGFRALTALIGRQMRPQARIRVNEDAAEERARVMARLAEPAVRARMEELNALDIAVHREVAADWDRIAAPLEAWLDRAEAQG